ncbi:amino acid ABC transporter ATP-binding protein [Jiella sonneratiae]|uniref:Amino acid ABC transporter ATP-binding protein n=1 Tax=Jiella sonneratiae TaxID=2816856 RepID=A0ABS3J869_9HYPH|nr:amino acid ABC transporter ATP-binding protein [Jiella sonneratiae]MBO0905862.1 amino acid ABC transporter ATP-binding protein [Jiella sonneratiae]
MSDTAPLAPRASTAETPEADAAVLVRGVTKRFGDTEVLAGIDLKVPTGATTCLIGPSGSGKSTLLRCIAFLEEATTGTIEIHGDPLGFAEAPDGGRTRLSPQSIRAVRSRIGMVFQQFNLWPHMTALGNVCEALVTVRRMRRSEAEEHGMAQLSRVGLANRAKHYPSELSGGQQQRVAIARALALDPEVMLFDEPTASLDPELTGEVLNVMRDLAGSGMTLLVVTHEIGFAATVGQRIAFLDHGRLLLDGTPREVFGEPRHPRLAQFLETYLDRGAAALV